MLMLNDIFKYSSLENDCDHECEYAINDELKEIGFERKMFSLTYGPHYF